MPNPITVEQYEQTLSLLRIDPLHERLLNHEIAARVGISESTVRNIRHCRIKRPGGTETLPPEPTPKPAPAPPRVKKHRDIDVQQVAAYVCKTCRNTVTTKPCLYCTIKGRG